MKRPWKRGGQSERENDESESAKRSRRTGRKSPWIRPKLRSRSEGGRKMSQYLPHPYPPPTGHMTPAQGENMYVVWTGEGKPVTVIKAKRASR